MRVLFHLFFLSCQNSYYPPSFDFCLSKNLAYYLNIAHRKIPHTYIKVYNLESEPRTAHLRRRMFEGYYLAVFLEKIIK